MMKLQLIVQTITIEDSLGEVSRKKAEEVAKWYLNVPLDQSIK